MCWCVCVCMPIRCTFFFIRWTSSWWSSVGTSRIFFLQYFRLHFKDLMAFNVSFHYYYYYFVVCSALRSAVFVCVLYATAMRMMLLWFFGNILCAHFLFLGFSIVFRMKKDMLSSVCGVLTLPENHSDWDGGGDRRMIWEWPLYILKLLIHDNHSLCIRCHWWCFGKHKLIGTFPFS